MAELIRTTYDSLGNRVTFVWDSRPTEADKTWALDTFKKARGLRFVQKWHEWDERKPQVGLHVDPRAHGFTMQRY